MLHRACIKLGGLDALAAHLEVPAALLYEWLQGGSEPPASVFLRAVDLVMPNWTDQDDALARELMSTPPGKRAH